MQKQAQGSNCFHYCACAGKGSQYFFLVLASAIALASLVKTKNSFIVIFINYWPIIFAFPCTVCLFASKLIPESRSEENEPALLHGYQSFGHTHLHITIEFCLVLFF